LLSVEEKRTSGGASAAGHEGDGEAMDGR
jgi:hypothetical protein